MSAILALLLDRLPSIIAAIATLRGVPNAQETIDELIVTAKDIIKILKSKPLDDIGRAKLDLLIDQMASAPEQTIID